MTGETPAHADRSRARQPAPCLALLVAAGVWLPLACEVDGRPLRVVAPARPPAGVGLMDAAVPPPPAEMAPPSALEDAGSAGPCAVGQFAAECPAVRCPPDDVCRNYVPSIAAGTCVAPGRCATVADCSLTWTAAARTGDACSCEGGRCTLRIGESCANGADCQTGACVTIAGAAARSVCCIRDCNSTEVCAVAGTACVPAPVCTNGDRRCSGSSYELCAAGQWTLEAVCGAAGCSLAAGGCLAPPAAPDPMSLPTTCSDACVAPTLIADGTCNDGSTNDLFICDPGTDCTDCGVGPNGCSDVCRVPEFNADGVCDDGGPGALFAVCALGTDCTDCGDRAP